MAYLPIEDYGVIGNMRTSALVGINGSIDWMCWPHFDSPSLFCGILDARKGGHFQISLAESEDKSCTTCEGKPPISPDRRVRSRQHYWVDTNVLVTRFMSLCGTADITDFMPIPPSSETFCGTNGTSSSQMEGTHRAGIYPDPHALETLQLVRKVSVITQSSMKFKVSVCPAFDYARQVHHTYVIPGKGLFFIPIRSRDQPQKEEPFSRCYPYPLTMGIITSVPLNANGEGEFVLTTGESVFFMLRYVQIPLPKVGSEIDPKVIDLSFPRPLSITDGDHLLDDCIAFWKHWIDKSSYRTGRWKEQMRRSALVLKLLTFEPTGAIVAAPTTSLPEWIGGRRNWDYRFTWMRDASLVVYGLLRMGLKNESTAFMGWLENICRKSKNGELQVMYSLDGGTVGDEIVLDHLEGYAGSSPVRIGNGAKDHLQLDIYGELIDSIYLYNKYVQPLSYDLWTHVRDMVNYVCDHWKDKDQSIWESRGRKQNHVYSKVLMWVAVDRSLRLAERRSFPAPNRLKWLQTRDEIYEEVMHLGWSERQQSFIQAYESPILDGALLIMPLMLFVSPTDPRMLKTLTAVREQLSVGDFLIRRYDVSEMDDGFHQEEEGAFIMLTFWMIECLTKAGRYDPAKLLEAQHLFEQMLANSNHLGLFSEEFGFRGEGLLGNFPQAFTHLSLISTAFALERALNESP